MRRPLFTALAAAALLLGLLLFTAPASAQGACEATDLGPVEIGTTVHGRGTLAAGDCDSGWYSGSPIDEFTFSLIDEAVVTMQAHSAAFDPAVHAYGYDHRGYDADDDSGPGHNASLTMRLLPGTWSLNVTTSALLEEWGAYRVSVTAAWAPVLLLYDCGPYDLGAVTAARTIDSRFFPGSCTSEAREDRYSHIYEFSLPEALSLQIDLTAPIVDPYLHLYDADGNTISRNDDGGGSLNSRIAKILPAGDYALEVTTYAAREFGDYQLQLTPIADEVHLLARRLADGSWEVGLRTAGGLDLLPAQRVVRAGAGGWVASSALAHSGIEYGAVRARLLPSGNLALSLRTPDGAVHSPRLRLAPADAEVGRWLASSLLQLP